MNLKKNGKYYQIVDVVNGKRKVILHLGTVEKIYEKLMGLKDGTKQPLVDEEIITPKVRPITIKRSFEDAKAAADLLMDDILRKEKEK